MPLPALTAERLLNHINGRTPLTIVGPLKLYIYGFPTGGSPNQVTVGPQPITLSLGVRDTDSNLDYWEATNEAAVIFPNMPGPGITVTNWFITDSSPTPVTCWEGTTVRNRDVPPGDSYEVPAGALKVRLVF